MSAQWSAAQAPHLRITALGYLRAALRALPLLVLISGGLAVLLLLRLVERPVYGPRRPVTPHITRFVCRNGLRILGIGYRIEGLPMQGAGAVVSNHASWLDIFALNAAKPITFVAKSEVAGWPGIGWLARATGTLFIRRDRKEAAAQIAQFRSRLAVGDRLLFFPEGTSTDGLRVLPFKPTLFAAFFDPALRDRLQVQAVTLVYQAPSGTDPRFYGWWGDMDLAPHLLATLAVARPGRITLRYAPPVALQDYPDRKALARALEDQVRAGLVAHDGAEL